ncbi:MAG: hypothetical protein Q7S31_01110 [bacterium]|nr:hypothetical protein [bacterium]
MILEIEGAQSIPKDTAFSLICETCCRVIMTSLTHPRFDATIWSVAAFQFDGHKNHFVSSPHNLVCVDMNTMLSYPAEALIDINPWAYPA